MIANYRAHRNVSPASADPQTRPSASNVIDLDLHLIRDAAWKIDHESQQFAPGGGP
jgi:hypothetical protein